MRIPRDIDGKTMVTLLSKFGYKATRQTGSHVRLTSTASGEEHHVTIPLHNPLRVGTISSILGDVSKYLNMSKEELIKSILS